MGIPYDNIERVQWRVDDGDINTCDFRIVNGIKYIPERVSKVKWKHVGGDVAAGYCECGQELDRCHDYEPAHLPNYCPDCGAKCIDGDA